MGGTPASVVSLHLRRGGGTAVEGLQGLHQQLRDTSGSEEFPEEGMLDPVKSFTLVCLDKVPGPIILRMQASDVPEGAQQLFHMSSGHSTGLHGVKQVRG